MIIRAPEENYEVKLTIFEGPLDLLLYLVQKNELDPRHISIATITDQYLTFIEGMVEMNLGNAGEFLVMAARLMRLKARELLPAGEKDELEEMEYELDREALIQQMLEYQKFKEAARTLRNFEGKHFGAFPRGLPDVPHKEENVATAWDEEAGIFDLLSAFRSAIRPRSTIPVHEVEIDDVTIEDMMQQIEGIMMDQGRSLFEDLFSQDSRRIAKVVTFMSVLELARLDKILLRQSRNFAAIWIYRKRDNAAFSLETDRDDRHVDELPEFRPGLVEYVQELIKKRTSENSLDAILAELGESPLAQTQKDEEAVSIPEES